MLIQDLFITIFALVIFALLGLIAYYRREISELVDENHELKVDIRKLKHELRSK